MLGLLWWRSGRIDLAVESYAAALDVKPDYPEAEAALASVLLESGRPEVAIQHYRRALELQPDYPVAQRGLNLALQQMQAAKLRSVAPPTSATRPAH